MYRILLLVTIALLSGCTTQTRFHGNPMQSMNASLSAWETGHSGDTSLEETAQLRRIYADSPNFLALLDRPLTAQTKLPRVKWMGPPKYPLGPFLSEVEAQVSIAFVVDETGMVADTRVFQTSDERFYAAAKEAVGRWMFYPGSVDGRPAAFIFVVPVVFRLQ